MESLTCSGPFSQVGAVTWSAGEFSATCYHVHVCVSACACEHDHLSVVCYLKWLALMLCPDTSALVGNQWRSCMINEWISVSSRASWEWGSHIIWWGVTLKVAVATVVCEGVGICEETTVCIAVSHGWAAVNGVTGSVNSLTFELINAPIVCGHTPVGYLAVMSKWILHGYIVIRTRPEEAQIWNCKPLPE